MLDKYEGKAIGITAIIIMVFLFSLLYVTGKQKTDVVECVPYDKTYTTPRINQIDSTTYQVFAVAKMWNFEPSQIYVPVGAEVDFFVTSGDVVHGFNIAEKNVNMMAVYGGINKTTVKFTEPGIYKITCHEYCGVGHQNMQAEVIVNYPNNY
ncbi:cytochrome c oxidase subunit 2 [Chitinophaga skermanii]|uniref:Cytochrome c oxidase subunit 2 n=1 Tax=Chitinophaga skermanii TaxID=331697 RepID=A0A327R287_9BACT|nr:cytochrome C oxidase subunit II [Chitinophaga skermanii]RAJ10959.1 cytochrome c oxidase subunit 2 [Chitinophaga skermanii]